MHFHTLFFLVFTFQRSFGFVYPNHGGAFKMPSAVTSSIGMHSKSDSPCSDDSPQEHRSLGKLSRRDFFVGSASFSLFSLGTTFDAAFALPVYPDVRGKTIVITGSNSGIGFDAATRLALRGCKVVLACRTLEKAKDAMKRILADNENKNLDLIPMECDLSSLESISAFASNFNSENPIDVLCLNAGLARDVGSKEVLRTKDGFELTIGTNHLGHFYLSSLLLDSKKINPDVGRVVVTASGVHDPDSPGGAQGSLATLGDLSGLEGGPNFEMVDGKAFDPDKAYKDSKLCNVFFTRELERRLDEKGSKIRAYCFNPGLIVGTGLFREQNKVFTKIFDFAATDLLKVGETTHFGGGCLEYMAISNELPRNGGYFTSAPGSSKFGDDAFGLQFHDTEVSKEARDREKGMKLWSVSEKLVGIKV